MKLRSKSLDLHPACYTRPSPLSQRPAAEEMCLAGMALQRPPHALVPAAMRVRAHSPKSKESPLFPFLQLVNHNAISGYWGVHARRGPPAPCGPLHSTAVLYSPPPQGVPLLPSNDDQRRPKSLRTCSSNGGGGATAVITPSFCSRVRPVSVTRNGLF